MFEELILRAFLGGAVLSAASGPIGCFILWRKLAYFGDTLAHSALLGVAFSLFLGIEATFGVFLIAVAISLLLITIQKTRLFSNDAILGILSHSSLAFGLIAVSLSNNGALQLTSLLFGDILAISWTDIWISLAVAGVILAILISQWRNLVANSMNADIARVERIGSGSAEILFMILCSGLVAIAMKITGVLLISALLILPAAIARVFARSPEMMAVLAVVFGLASISGGLWLSLFFDIPSGPAIIAAAAIYFATVILISRISKMWL